MGGVMTIPLPTMYVTLMGALSFFELDFVRVIPLACIGASYNFYSSLMVSVVSIAWW